MLCFPDHSLQSAVLPGAEDLCCHPGGVDREARRISLTHRELLGTWAENAAGFRAGQAVTGIVRSVQPYGAFIELTPNLSGLAEPEDGLEPGQLVSVYIRSILPEKQKIKLTVLEQLDPRNVPPQLLRYYRTVGCLDRWGIRPGQRNRYGFLISCQYCFAACSSLLGPYS